MKNKAIKRKIRGKKMLLNFLLKFLSPSNKLIIVLSQSLDKPLVVAQGHMYRKYKRCSTRRYVFPLRKTA